MAILLPSEASSAPKMNRPLLYTYRRCPYAMRARMALLQAGKAFDVYEISLRDKPKSMLAASSKGTVPVLVVPDGLVIEESLEIMRWALSEHDLEGWWSRSQSSGNLALIAETDASFKQHLDRYKYPERYEPNQRGHHQQEAMSGLIRSLEQKLAIEPFLGGKTPCAADLAVFPFVRQFRAVDADWFDAQPIVATQRWLRTWLSSALFEACMKKLPANSRVPYQADVG